MRFLSAARWRLMVCIMTVGKLIDSVLMQTVGKPYRLESVHISISELRFHFVTLTDRGHFQTIIRRDELARGTAAKIIRSVEKDIGRLPT